MSKTTENRVAETFAAELRSFFGLCLWNLVFGSLAMAFGMQFILAAILAMAATGDFGIFPFLQALIGWAGAVIGFRWILSSARILKGVNRIRREYRALAGSAPGETGGRVLEGPGPGTTGEPVPGLRRAAASGDALTGLIIRMMAHYRENWKTVWRMNLISTLGGAIFLALGVANLVQGVSGWHEAAGLSSLPAFLAAGINLAIGIVSLLFSSWFRRYARAWELRLIEAGHAEEDLKESMEQG
jgi:hypothetical protein